MQPGQVLWGHEQIHIGENVGTTETHVIMVELKKALDAPPQRKGRALLAAPGRGKA